MPNLQVRKPRALCFDAFAVLRSGRSNTPIFAVERLTAVQLVEAASKKCTTKLFADARLPA